jgi:hypothetical protein
LIGSGLNRKPLETIEFRIFNGTSKISKFTKNINFLIKTLNEHFNETELEFGIQKETPKKTQPIVIRKFVGTEQ